MALEEIVKAEPTLPPEMLRFGSVLFIEVHSLAKAFGMSVAGATRTMALLDVPLTCIGTGRFIAQHALEKALYLVSKFGGPGFAAPGSRTKRNSRRNTSPTIINHKDFTPGELKSATTDLERMDANRAKAKEKSVKRLVRDIARSKSPLMQGGPDA